MSQHATPAGDLRRLFECLAELKRKALARTGKTYPIIVIQEAGLDGFWIHRALEREGIESHVVDAASIAVPRRRRRAKTDRIDGKTLLRTLMAFKRGEPRVCAMAKPPSVEEEDRRRLGRERKTLIAERVEHVNRIKGLLFTQGAIDYQPLRRDRRARIKAVEAERDALLAEQSRQAPAAAGMLLAFKGIGPEFAAVLWLEGLFRSFANRRQVAAYAGLAPTPWRSGSIAREQGASKAGNPRLRATLIELAWLWRRHQPKSALTLWFEDRVKANGGRVKKALLVALARKLLVALWKYVTTGLVIEGAVMTTA
jgi:transposase